MESEAALDALLTRIGFNTIAKREEITNQGINTCNDLADLSDNELQAIYDENKNHNRRRTVNNQIVLPILAKARLEAIRYEMELRTMCDKPMNDQQIQEVTLTVAKEFVKQKKQREEGIKQASTLPTPVLPKLSKGNWRAVRLVR